MLKQLLERRMRELNLSVRSAADAMGVSHTTIHRVINDEQVDLKTLIAVCRWLGVRPSTILDTEANNEKVSISSTVASIIERDPRLATVFSEVAKEVERGNVNVEDVEDILSYTLYRLGNAKRQRSQTDGEG